MVIWWICRGCFWRAISPLRFNKMENGMAELIRQLGDHRPNLLCGSRFPQNDVVSLTIRRMISRGLLLNGDAPMDRRAALLAFAFLLIPGSASALGRPPPGPTGGWHFPPPPPPPDP